VTNNQKEKWC